jgi:hypothetical protein
MGMKKRSRKESILIALILFFSMINLPRSAGASTFFTESFEDANFASRSWYDNTNHGTIVPEGKTGNCLQWAWTAGQTTPLNGGALRKKIPPTENLYISLYVKFQPTWKGSQKGYHPHLVLVPSNLDVDYCPLAENFLNTYLEFISDTVSPYHIRPSVAIQDSLRVNVAYGSPPNNLTEITESRSVAHCNGCKTGADCGTGICYNVGGWYSAYAWKTSYSSVPKNQWVHIEAYFRMNSIHSNVGQADGVMQIWIDGVNVLNLSKMIYRTHQDEMKKWAQFVLAPYIGDGSPIAQTMWVDELKVGTESPYPNPTRISPPTGLRIMPP